MRERGLKAYTKFHHTNKKFSYQNDNFANNLLKNKKNSFLISCSLSNAGFYYAIDGYDVMVKHISDELYNPYKYIDLNNISQINKIFGKF